MLFAFSAIAQETIVSGKVTDAESGDPIPFANVYFSGTDIGMTTNFDGLYRLRTSSKVDTLIVSYIGYNKKSRLVAKGKEQVINFQLESTVTRLQEIVVYAGENPAFEIIRKAVKNKNKNDKKLLQAYQYESYNKIEVDVDNISEKFKNRRIMKKISQVMDSLDQIAGEDGKPILPIFISESLSEFYFRDNPKLKREHILKTKIHGVFVEDGSLLSQLIGSSFQEYNFYQNWLNIVEKDFVSPIADGWRVYYDYDLTDSLYIGDHFCYRLEVRPRRPQDLAFSGTIWITSDTYALKQIDVSIAKSANLNFIEKIKLQQELAPTEAGPWLPVKTRVLIDVSELSSGSAGMLAKFYSSNKNFVINQPQKNKFYETPIEVAEDSRIYEPDFWEKNRHDSLTPTEVNVYGMIDTLKNIPVVKSYVEIFNILTYGYKDLGKVDFGPYMYTYAFNSVEGHRFRAGLKTNTDFSRKWIFKGYLAYGTLDKEFKYGASVRYIFSRKPWTMASIERIRDLEQVGLNREELEDNYVFYAFSKIGELRRPYINTLNRLSFQSEIRKGITQKISFSNQKFDPLFPFEYYTQPGNNESPVASEFTTSEVHLETRFAKGELFIQNENDRISLGANKWPIVTFNYMMGLKGVLGSDFEYHKVSLNISQSIKTGFLGRSYYSITGGQVLTPLPYPLLKVHIGNESPFFTSAAFNLMNYFEFVSDRYVSLRYQHFFEGFLTNNIPLMRRLKWRLVATGNLLYGSAHKKNFNLMPEIHSNGEPLPQFNALNPNKPYVELGYGIENIFKFIRVDAYHRITYLKNPEVSKFGVKLNFQLIL
ncbi:DUF5686 family protein [soil metagenome]